MSEPANTFCLNTPTNWKHYRHQISSNWKKNKNIIYNKHRRKTFLTLLNCHNRRRQKEKLIIRKQQRGDLHHPSVFTFPLHLKLNFTGLGTRRNSSHKTGYKGVAKAYFCSVKKRSISEAGSNTGIDIYKLKQKMANTLSVMTNVLRNVVSKQRIRYKEKGFNLDLAYVCDNIIAMGYPAEKYESMYRNRLEDVFKFLEENHRDHYKIYNLCLERSYDIKKFHGRVSVYPFEDHNPPTIELIQKFCKDVDLWLKADALNVAAVHCKAGKGRTGTMICCYLIYSGQQRTADDALSCYDEKRTKDRKGVTIPSQRRYVQYFSKLIRLDLSYERRTLQFCEIRFSDANILHSHGTVHCSISVLQDVEGTVKVQPLQNLTIDFRKNSVLDIKNPPLTVAGDIKVELTKNSKKIFHFWFNTFFVTDSANSVTEGVGNDVKFIYTLHKCEIDDAHKDKEHKNFSEDFKVELVFYIDENIVGLDHTQVSSSNRLASNQCAAASVRLPPPATQSNNYSLPQNNSSGSEMNFLCDQKSSSSTSVSSSLGGGANTDNSNGFESNTQQRPAPLRSSCAAPQQQFSNSHHSHPYVAMQDANSVRFISPQASPQPTAISTSTQQAPPGFMMELHHQRPQHIHKDNMHHLQQMIKDTPTTAGSAPNQRHMQRQSASGGAVSAVLQRVINTTNMDAMSRQPSGNVNATNSNTSYNHSTNSSKTSSVSSQSSSAIGDNEEDWESGESSAKQLDHITLLLSSSFVTTTPAPPIQLFSHNNTSTKLSYKKDLPRGDQKNNTGIQHSSSSASASTCTSSTSNSSSSSVFSSSKCPNNKSNTSNSSCTNRVVGGDDDDDDDDDFDNNDVDDDKDRRIKSVNAKTIIVAKQKETSSISTQTTGSISKPVESNKDTDQSKAASEIATPAPAGTRPKLMHLLMAPKHNSNNNGTTHQSTHKPIFKRKSSYKLTMSNAAATRSGTSDSNHASHVDPNLTECCSSGEPAVGNFGGVATTSKQKLKIKLKQNKLKLSQKFQWFQSYFRSDPVDFCENFVQQTTSMRRNSICSMASRTHKLSTTTPPSVTPPPPPITGVADGSSSSEQLNDRGVSVSVSQSTSNASIATGDLCEDYYSYICDNQLSFSNSPCKSPRSLADIASSINGGGSGGGTVGSFGSSFARSGGSNFRERRDTMPGIGISSHNVRRNNVVIVAAKPAKTHAIGFNVNATGAALNFEQRPSLARHDSTDASPASIYHTPNSGSMPPKENTGENTAFEFPQRADVGQVAAAQNIVFESDGNHRIEDADNKSATSRLQPKYSLNLVIVKECPYESSTKSTFNDSDDGDSDICRDQDQNISVVQLNRIAGHSVSEEDGSQAMAHPAESNIDEFSETKVTAATCASICSNSSSSGFCTSECCTTNSSSSSCNCNPFTAFLERHAALAIITRQQQQEQKQQQDTIHEIIESSSTSEDVPPAHSDPSQNRIESQGQESSDSMVEEVTLDTKRD